MSREYLDEALAKYSRSNIYPFHMPGHKRRGSLFVSQCDGLAEDQYMISPKNGKFLQDDSQWSAIWGMDITEIDGFDNLHQAVGILKEAQQRAAELYGAAHSFYLVNGSTCGVLAAICAAAGKRERVLVARNCHKSVYHALFLQELTAEYLYPVVMEDKIPGQITPEQVEEALQRQPAAAVVITSPTYEGVLSDVAGIAEAAHRHGVPLIVDAAHGAHLGFGGGFPEGPVRQGADAVVMSLHKTLPSLTQTALLHICSGRIDLERVKKYLEVFETSSPSYLLMAGMDACIRLLRTNGSELFARYRRILTEFYRQTADLRQLHVMTREDFSPREAYEWDDGKLIVFVRHPAYGGPWLHRRLLTEYHLQSEMVSARFVLLMTSVMDEPQGLRRLAAALRDTDDWLTGQSQEETGFDNCRSLAVTNLYQKYEISMPIYQAESGKKEQIALEDCAGRISADMVYLYPPAIPVLVPGEIISASFPGELRKCQEMGLSVGGSGHISVGRISVVCPLADTGV